MSRSVRHAGRDRLEKWTDAHFTRLVGFVGEDLGYLDIWSASPESLRFAISRAQRLMAQRVVAEPDPKPAIDPRIASLLDDFRSHALMSLSERMEDMFAGITVRKLQRSARAEGCAALRPVDRDR